jgi:ankyrin repeat protein
MILNKDGKIQVECLDFAIQNINIELIKLFLNIGIMTEQSLFIAIEIENLEVIKMLIPYYQNFTSRIRNGWSLLHCAVYTGNIQICKLLLDNGCFINAVDNYGMSPLHVAVHGNGGLLMVKFLCKSGACMDLKSLSGISPLIRAVMCRNYGVCNYLIAEGCDVGITTVGGATAASIANMKGYYRIQQLLSPFLKKLIK